MSSAPRVIIFGIWIAAWAFVLVQRGNAANIAVNGPDAYGRTFVDVVGTIELEDVQTFETKTANLHGVVVTLISYGGNPIAAIQMGEMIRTNAMTTFVPGERVCASACSIVWLAGAPRTVGTDAHIGFHAAYNATTGQESGAANALVGAYLGKLGLDYKAIYFMTASGPKSMAWLTPGLANEWGVTYDNLHSPRALPVPPQPALLPRAAQPVPTRAVVHTLLGAGLPMHVGLLLSPRILTIPESAAVTIEDDCSHHVSWAPWCLVIYGGQRGYVNGIYLTVVSPPPPRRLPQPSPQPQPQPPSIAESQPPKKLWSKAYAGVATGDLVFRRAPDPKADPVQPDPIPEGTEVSLYADCEVWRGSGRGERDADNIWCPVISGTQKGWANGFYLQMRNGRRMACISYPAANLCPASEHPPLPQESPQQKNARLRVLQDLTLRTAPDPHSDKVLEEIPKDALVELTYQGGGFPFGCRKGPSSATWCPVTYETYKGWVNAFYLGARGRPTTDLNLRRTPDLRSDVVLEIPKGGIVEIDHLSDCRTAGEAGSMVPWCPVSYAGQSGWVNPTYLSFERHVFTSARPAEASP